MAQGERISLIAGRLGSDGPGSGQGRQIFVSYSHEDKPLIERFIRHLRVIAKHKKTYFFWDQDIESGSRWCSEIGQAIDESSLALVMVSTGLLNSSFVSEFELPRMFDREIHGLCIKPILLLPCPWQVCPWLRDRQIYMAKGRSLGVGTEEEIETHFAALALKVLDWLGADPNPDGDTPAALPCPRGSDHNSGALEAAKILLAKDRFGGKGFAHQWSMLLLSACRATLVEERSIILTDRPYVYLGIYGSESSDSIPTLFHFAGHGVQGDELILLGNKAQRKMRVLLPPASPMRGSEIGTAFCILSGCRKDVAGRLKTAVLDLEVGDNAVPACRDEHKSFDLGYSYYYCDGDINFAQVTDVSLNGPGAIGTYHTLGFDYYNYHGNGMFTDQSFGQLQTFGWGIIFDFDNSGDQDIYYAGMDPWITRDIHFSLSRNLGCNPYYFAVVTDYKRYSMYDEATGGMYNNSFDDIVSAVSGIVPALTHYPQYRFLQYAHSAVGRAVKLMQLKDGKPIIHPGAASYTSEDSLKFSGGLDLYEQAALCPQQSESDRGRGFADEFERLNRIFLDPQLQGVREDVFGTRRPDHEHASGVFSSWTWSGGRRRDYQQLDVFVVLPEPHETMVMSLWRVEPLGDFPQSGCYRADDRSIGDPVS